MSRYGFRTGARRIAAYLDCCVGPNNPDAPHDDMIGPLMPRPLPRVR